MEILKKMFNTLTLYLQLIIILCVFLNTYLVFFSLDLKHLNMKELLLNSMNKESEKMLVVTGNWTQGHWHQPSVALTTKLQQVPEDHQHNPLYTARVVLNASVAHQAATMYAPCAIFHLFSMWGMTSKELLIILFMMKFKCRTQGN